MLNGMKYSFSRMPYSDIFFIKYLVGSINCLIVKLIFLRKKEASASLFYFIEILEFN